MDRRRTRRNQSDSFYKDNKNRTRKDNENNYTSRKSNNREYSRNNYTKPLGKENSTSEGNKKFENPKFFYKRVHGNYSKLYVPEAYDKKPEKKNSPKNGQETHSHLEFQDVSSNVENQNNNNQFSNATVREKNKDIKVSELDDKKEKLKTIYSQIKNMENKLDKDVLIEELNEYKFDILSRDHLQLITKYIELIQENYKVAVIKYEMDIKVWKLGIYKLFNLFRNYLNDFYSYQNKESVLDENVKQIFACFINESLKSVNALASILKPYDTNSNITLHENTKFNRYQIAWHRCMFYINDLLRYQYLHGLKPSEDLEDLWKRANFINKNIINISPNNGLLYHQMAILHLSNDNKFETLYYFLRSLCVKNPYNKARETHLSFFDNIFKEFTNVCNEFSSVYNIETFSVQFAHLHGILYTKIGTETFNGILKRLMKGIKMQSEKLSSFWIRTSALCNIAILHHYLNINNENLLDLPIQLILEQLEVNIRIFLEKQDKKFLHHVEVFLYWIILSLQNKEAYVELMKPKLKTIWSLLVKTCNLIEQDLLLDENIEIQVRDNFSDEYQNSNENDDINSEDEMKNKIDSYKDNYLKPLKFVVIKNGDNGDEVQSYTFSFNKLYDLEYRGFAPLQNLFSFIQYKDTISNYDHWYNEIMDKCNNFNNIENNFEDDNISNCNYDVEKERIIILMHVVKKFVNEISFDGCYWNYKYTTKNNNYKNHTYENKNEFDNINFDEISDHEEYPIEHNDIFNTFNQDIYSNNNNSDFDELKKTKQMLYEFITDPNEKEEEVIINPQLTKIIFDTNCYMKSLNSIKNIFENTNLNIIIPLAVINELSGLQNSKKQAKIALDYLKFIVGQSNHRALLKVVTAKGSVLRNIDNIYHESWENKGDNYMNTDDVIISCFTTNLSNYNQNTNNLNYTKNILVSSDKNMRVKARSQKIMAFNDNEFINILKKKKILS
ncbi:hypothetical protein BCR36DRAFT_360598 [Piromyces finnis]|uniref:PIN domain-containing protein n=1 Tax=Piromyces finnis TaxID=1754191 RepID=A0A1Y1UZ85_9FUNG|nr:hypothetical protein BCR36DRAFT_360598 [Piromyces finnis]|eukprot:ORX43791.1 hypothetical protein BCR36DRAFT_360598 [Piromyces finnis]